MDYKLRQIAGNKPAGQYFIVSDESNATQIMPNGNVRVIFLNEKQGAVNTGVFFNRGAISDFQAMYGKRNRRSEKQGNFGIKDGISMLGTSGILAINLRAFDDTLDRTTLVNMGANKKWEKMVETPYEKLFNRNGFWTPNSDQILDIFGVEDNLLNFANVGEGDVSIMVTMATPTEVSALTSHGKKTLIEATDVMDIEDFDAIIFDQNKLLNETFVNVYVFKNNFADKHDNVTYKHFFNETGLINQSDIDALSRLKSSGFDRKFTGSLIPFLKDGINDLSIDVIVNQYYQETGLYLTINSDVLEHESYGEQPILNTLYKGYHNANGDLIDDGNLLSYRFQNNPENIVNVELGVDDSDADLRSKEMLVYSGEIFPTDKKYGNQIYAILENGVRYGDTLFFEDKDSQKLVDTRVIAMVLDTEIVKDIPKVKITDISFELTIENGKPKIVITDTETTNTYNIIRKRVGDDNFVAIRTNSDKTFVDVNATNSATYVYSVIVKNDEFSDNVLEAKSIKVLDGEVSEASTETYPTIIKKMIYKRVLLTTDKNINSDSYTRRLKPYENGGLKVEMSTLNGYVQRPEQFVNGTPERQNQILDVMLSPSIVNGIVKLGNVGYLVDTFKSYVEAGYKRQFGNLIDELNECNRFVTAFINEPFLKDLEKSNDPLFKDSPSGILDLGAYLSEGGNPNFSTKFLTKFTTQIEMCSFHGAEENRPNIYPTSAEVSNLHILKPTAWSIVANDRGVLPISGVEIDGSEKERKAMEDFGWNPIIKLKGKFVIYGNRTGQTENTALRDFNNAELLKYIKTELLNMSMNDAFTTGTYDELLTFETKVKDFMDKLAIQNAIKPNPIVNVLSVNNQETEDARIKLCEIEYYNYKTLDKVVFSLKLK